MWRLEVVEDGIIVIKRVYKSIEDAVMAIGLRYQETKEDHDIRIHLGFIKKEA